MSYTPEQLKAIKLATRKVLKSTARVMDLQKQYYAGMKDQMTLRECKNAEARLRREIAEWEVLTGTKMIELNDQ